MIWNEQDARSFLRDGDEPPRETLWSAHWRRAHGAATADEVVGLLDSHLEAYTKELGGCGSITGGRERLELIGFLSDRLDQEFKYRIKRGRLRFPLPWEEQRELELCMQPKVVKASV